ncbi:MAG: hypothetical protein H0X17_12680 [Deltaproteobacteria bacterium]|nr:hypothetical protein [Deltaproteobacteria bacterium]
MNAWAGIAIAQAALLVLSLRRLWRTYPLPAPTAPEIADGEPPVLGAAAPESGAVATGTPAPVLTIWWPGIAILVIASLAATVFVGDGGPWVAFAIFGTLVLATDVALLGGVLVASLCTRSRGA